MSPRVEYVRGWRVPNSPLEREAIALVGRLLRAYLAAEEHAGWGEVDLERARRGRRPEDQVRAEIELEDRVDAFFRAHVALKAADGALRRVREDLRREEAERAEREARERAARCRCCDHLAPCPDTGDGRDCALRACDRCRLDASGDE